MLVLSRKVGEAIHISSGITVVVARIGKGRVRLGIEAPRSARIVRTELFATQGEANPSEGGTGNATQFERLPSSSE